MLSITNEKWAILAILNVFFLIIGMFLHSAAAIVARTVTQSRIVTASQNGDLPDCRPDCLLQTLC
jgi:TRAP-type C4-dicarboxylate transport system permease large subunit